MSGKPEAGDDPVAGAHGDGQAEKPDPSRQVVQPSSVLEVRERERGVEGKKERERGIVRNRGTKE